MPKMYFFSPISLLNFILQITVIIIIDGKIEGINLLPHSIIVSKIQSLSSEEKTMISASNNIAVKRVKKLVILFVIIIAPFS